MPKVTLHQIQCEANNLEIDLRLVDGFLHLHKRGDASLYYIAAQKINDPRVLTSAWQWLQTYRTNLQRIDEVRAQLAANQDSGGQGVALAQARTRLVKQSVGSKATRKGNVFTAEPLFIAHCSFALGLSSIIGLLTGKILVGLCVVLPLIAVIFVPRTIYQRRKPKQS